MKDEQPITMLDLCSGIGGFSVAAGWLGWRTVAFCESDEFCRDLLAKRWPNTPIHHDLKLLDGAEYRGTDVLCCGFPCQPFSVANLAGERGTGDDRYLWPEVCRVIARTRPTWCVLENVTGIVTVALDSVLADMENLSYTTRSFIVPSASIDAPHKRDRIWLVAYSHGSQLEGVRCSGRVEPQFTYTLRGGEGGATVRTLAKTSVNGSSGQGEPWQRSNTETVSKGEADDAGHGCEQHQRTPEPRLGGKLFDGLSPWMDEPDIPRVCEGVRHRKSRLTAIGNAIQPQVAHEFLRLIDTLHNETPVQSKGVGEDSQVHAEMDGHQ